MAISYELARSDRKTIGIYVKPNGDVIVRAPRRASVKSIERFVQSKADWIETALQKLASRPTLPKLTDEERKELMAHAKETIPPLVEEIASKLGISYGRVTIRLQHTRWGSCSAKGNLNFNALLMFAPREVMLYVIVHELCHRRELNHSKAFWALVASVMPSYRSCEQWLKENGTALMSRL